ncbi:Predicted N-acyltransferase, GNAT family [Paenibacillus algorifonticola]|uniref:Predicted N-acyltransferase, GNAT family n=1 Tax=Paenibacillus algorifonticola TaxID=684063 RepID=A0A1I2G3A4_9BACL|nr:GNAT family N-acetyltransferase [Paenibacillus algorifonticola]SFF12154.1 Predicted N-acyltransferase, GNAT family [Paenibacillus algorifonticola]
MSITTRLVQNQEDRDAVFEVRRNVFVDEQGVPAANEYDEFEDTAQHLLALSGQVPVGAGRLRVVGGVAKLERICILADYRKLGIGKIIVEAIEQAAAAQGLTAAKLNAQTHAEGFYSKLGYRTVSDIFFEEGMPHVTMTKQLAQQG